MSKSLKRVTAALEAAGLAAEIREARNDDGVEAVVLRIDSPGGAVASAIGERLARLAKGGQLLAVTHSPQVAARGHRHYVIAKSSDGTVTRTSVHMLDGAGRQEEIARMLSGAEITAEARAQAVETLLTNSGVQGEVRVEGLGARQPLAMGNSSTAKSRNRRVEIFISPNR